MKHETFISASLFLVGLLPIVALPLFQSVPISAFSYLALCWMGSPLIVALIFISTRATGAAWGWLVGVTIANSWVTFGLLVGPSTSTGALAVLWIPVWNFVIVGPIAAGVGMMLRNKIRRTDAQG